MVTGARTFSLEDTFLSPQILNPPPTRHALLAFVLVLAAVLHISTAGQGELSDGAEGQLGGGARAMVESHHWLLPRNNGTPIPETPLLAYWLVAGSIKIFGLTPTAARLPIALAMVASVAFTFLIGERLAGYWRGFAAALVQIFFSGSFVAGRMVTSDAVFAALAAAAIFCAVAGYQRRQFRRAWFAGFWFCAGLACLAKGLVALISLAGVCFFLAIFFREARLRLAHLLHWSYLLFFIALVAPWFVWVEMHFPGSLLRIQPDYPAGLPRGHFLLLHLAWWFPALLLVLPGLVWNMRRVIRPAEITFAEALPLLWAAVGFIPFFLAGERQVASSMSIWPAVALCLACVWERMPRSSRLAGILLVTLAGAALGVIAWLARDSMDAILPAGFAGADLLALQPAVRIAALALIFFSLPALYFARKQRAEIVLLLALAPMLPVGFCLIESASFVAPAFSKAEVARYLNPRLGATGQVLFEGPLRNANSLSFYLNKNFFLVNQAPRAFETSEAERNKYLDENFVLEAWSRSDPIFLIIERRRVPYWRKLVMDRVHIYHQVTNSGRYVVLSNQL